jgi:hypothetical protein
VYRAQLTDATSDREALLRLWADNLPVRGGVEAKRRWLYLEHPCGPAQAFVLRDGETAIGCAGITTRELWYAGQPVRAALLADFAVDKAHRTGLPALVLQRAVKRHVDATYQLSYGFPNTKAVAIHQRIGYIELGNMARYVRVLRHGGYLQRRYGRPFAARAAGFVLDRAKLVVRIARTLAPRSRFALRWLTDTDARFDRLWATARDNFGIACRRDAAFLRWRFLREPAQRAVIAAIVDRETAALHAYAVVAGVPGQIAELADVFGESIAAIDDLFALLAPALYRRGHTAIGFRFLGDPRIVELLQAHHFSLRDADRTVIVHPGAGCPIPAATLSDHRRWYVTDLDEDT